MYNSISTYMIHICVMYFQSLSVELVLRRRRPQIWRQMAPVLASLQL